MAMLSLSLEFRQIRIVISAYWCYHLLCTLGRPGTSGAPGQPGRPGQAGHGGKLE